MPGRRRLKNFGSGKRSASQSPIAIRFAGDSRLYGDLAWLWEIWDEPKVGFGPQCRRLTQLVRRHISGVGRTLLNLGCGGGKNAHNLKRYFRITGVDVSRSMLSIARKLNPECDFIQADIRTCRLERLFDVIFIDSAVSYMLSVGDLFAAFRTAFLHLRHGGVMIVTPDEVAGSFEQNRTIVSRAAAKCKPKDIDVVFVENKFDSNIHDSVYEGILVYLIRERGVLRIEIDRHVQGLFPIGVWREQLRLAGFAVCEYVDRGNDRKGVTFVCMKRDCGIGPL